MNKDAALDEAALSEELDLEGIEKPADRAYEGIRRAILSGMLPGGAHLGEVALARMTGTSRTPVREALRRIVGEGLAHEDGRSRFVAEFPFEEVAIVFDIRARLESYAARVAAERITDEELAELGRIIDAIDALDSEPRDRNTIRAFADLNTRFHAKIITATRSPQMQNLSVRATSIPLEMIKQFVWSQQVNIARSNQQHRDLLTALENHNAMAAEAIMSAHILSTRPNRPLPNTGPSE
ncbi:MAG: GntR family transcriptional regulator [Vannielia sp.]|uniref:GntR family transcriptional regulator n=1 Tax=Vannielia sp. TaxID=2813045 RepID=UPI003B8D1209